MNLKKNVTFGPKRPVPLEDLMHHTVCEGGHACILN